VAALGRSIALVKSHEKVKKETLVKILLFSRRKKAMVCKAFILLMATCWLSLLVLAAAAAAERPPPYVGRRHLSRRSAGTMQETSRSFVYTASMGSHGWISHSLGDPCGAGGPPPPPFDQVDTLSVSERTNAPMGAGSTILLAIRSLERVLVGP
jgi:hypothetical protein